VRELGLTNNVQQGQFKWTNKGVNSTDKKGNTIDKNMDDRGLGI
jgi:hypothetical protein